MCVYVYDCSGGVGGCHPQTSEVSWRCSSAIVWKMLKSNVGLSPDWSDKLFAYREVPQSVPILHSATCHIRTPGPVQAGSNLW